MYFKFFLEYGHHKLLNFSSINLYLDHVHLWKLTYFAWSCTHYFSGVRILTWHNWICIFFRFQIPKSNWNFWDNSASFYEQQSSQVQCPGYSSQCWSLPTLSRGFCCNNQLIRAISGQCGFCSCSNWWLVHGDVSGHSIILLLLAGTWSNFFRHTWIQVLICKLKFFFLGVLFL